MNQIIFVAVVVLLVAAVAVPRFRRGIGLAARQLGGVVQTARSRMAAVASASVIRAASAAYEDHRRRGGRPLTLIQVGVCESDFLRLHPAMASVQEAFARGVDPAPRLVLRDVPDVRRGGAIVIATDDDDRTERFTSVSPRSGPVDHTVSLVPAALRSTNIEYPITGDVVIIGRAPTADIVLPGSHLSARHATIARSGRRWTIVDVSRNGTWVDGRRIESGTAHPLVDGSSVRFADQGLTFRTVS